MASDYRPLEMAKQMMASALVLLDGIGESVAALHLQQAICILQREPAPASIEEVDAVLDSPDGRALMDRLGRRLGTGDALGA